MCGLAGVWATRGGDAEQLRRTVECMIAPIVHRGPDDKGVWTDDAVGLALGFRRLAIIDLSAAGHQPMQSQTGRFTVTFNGEIYNFRELRRELEASGARFRGHSDTEVMLAGFEHWGIAQAVRRFVGMFAFAVWDRHSRTLTLARDRVGIKPLYVSSSDGNVLFGSELKSLAAHPAFSRELDRHSLTSFLRYLYVPAPRTIYANALKLLPGHLMVISDPATPLPQPQPYWSVEDAARRGLANPLSVPDDVAIATLENVLRDAIGLRMVADVPLGAMLSGGIDSSVVVALMQQQSTRPVQTFTIAFDDPAFNEAAHASRIAAHLGTEHTELMLTGREALDLVPRLSTMFDEPLADPSQIPTFLVSQLARRSVTVALSGDGGDELFAGYNRYLYGERMMNRINRLHPSARRIASGAVHMLHPEQWDTLHAAVTRFSSGHRRRHPGQSLYKIARLLNAGTVPDMYQTLLSAWQDPARILPMASVAEDRVREILVDAAPMPLLNRMMLADQITYLPDDLLAKADRASMAVSLEMRVPLLDHRLLEFSWRLPPELLVRDGQGKWILRQVLYRHVPPPMVDRPKMGFSVPVNTWLRGPLRDWAESLLSREALQRDGIFSTEQVRGAWEHFLAGRSSNGLALWAVLLFRSWSDEWRVHA